MAKKTSSALDAALDSINKDYGSGSVMRMNEMPGIVNVVPTGNPLVDNALGVGGFPLGRIVELWGDNSAGKTTLCIQSMAQAQALGYQCAIVDAEHAFDPSYAELLGCDVDSLIVSQPDYGEMGLEIVERLALTGAVQMIVIDSVAGLTPRAMVEGDYGDSVTGDTPVYIRRDGMIDIVPIEDLYCGMRTFIRGQRVHRYSKFKSKGRSSIQVMTHLGWKDIKTVLLKRNLDKKPIQITHTGNGIVKTTGDHSLFQNQIPITPHEISPGETVDWIRPEKYNSRYPVSEEVAWLLGFFVAEGSFHGRMLSFPNTDYDLLMKAVGIAESELCVDVRVTTRTYPKGNPRKPLHTASCSTRSEVYELFKLCNTKTGKKKVPDIILNASVPLKEAFLEGFSEGDGRSGMGQGMILHTSDACVASGLNYLIHCVDRAGYMSFSDRGRLSTSGKVGRTEYLVGCASSGRTRRFCNEVVKIVEASEIPEFLYDIETEAGTFVGGVGGIVLHNSHVGLLARMMSQGMGKLKNVASKNGSLLLFTNQERETIGNMGYGPKTTQPGGRALKFYATQRLELKKIGQIKRGEDVIGNKTRIKVVKNKVAPPFKIAEVEMIFGQGFSYEGAVLDMATDAGLVSKSGNWFSVVVDGEETKLGNGREATREFLRENPELALGIHTAAKELLYV